MNVLQEGSVSAIVSRYREANSSLLEERPDFAAWLATEYKPLAGGWQY